MLQQLIRVSDIYGDAWDKFPPTVCQMVQVLTNRARDEIALTQDLASLEGMMEILLAGSTSSSVAAVGNNTSNSAPTWHASETAQKTFVVNVS